MEGNKEERYERLLEVLEQKRDEVDNWEEEAEAHLRQEYQALKKRVSDLVEELIQNPPPAPSRGMEVMGEWLGRHLEWCHRCEVLLEDLKRK